MVYGWMAVQLLLPFGYLLAIMGIAHMLRHRRSPSATIAWLLAFVLLPYVGVIAYLMFGGRKVRSNATRKEPLSLTPAEADERAPANDFDLLLQRFGLPGATRGNQVKMCANGVEGYAGLLQVIESAKRTLFVQTYIFNRDEIGQDVLQRLADKAAAGVSVRVLADGLGSLQTGRSFFEPLVAAGGRFAVFKPVLHIPFRGKTNLRNHRKIAVADARQALAGGMNITGEDMYVEMTSESWQDVSLLVEGPAAWHFEEIFRADWEFATGQPLASGHCDDESAEAPGDALVQVVPSGPDVAGDPLYAITITAAFRAQQRLWIVTPYFVPDDALVQALTLACRRGVDVRILVPAKSNHPLSDVAGACDLRDIEAAGGTVLGYLPGMVHAKVMLTDDCLAMVGSANMDMRSLFLNYEVMQLNYSRPEIDEVAAWIEALAVDCRRGVAQAGALRQIAEGLIRVVAPLF